ncbi:MAG: hypothetical protein LBH42_07015 [Treponema sp.]|jgi:hypothetical protein|nr:hypothetical protein [Treponema sp.]
MAWEKITHEEFLKDIENSIPPEDFERLRAALDVNGEQRRVYKDGELVGVNGVNVNGAVS